MAASCWSLLNLTRMRILAVIVISVALISPSLAKLDKSKPTKAPKSCEGDTMFKCTNSSECIPVRWECDGEDDCSDGSDEEPTKCNAKTCNPDQFSCGVGQPCIPQTWQCDTHEDCPDGADEMNCASRSCLADEFQCNNGLCVTMRWRCDQDNDCTDGSDEKDCAPPTCPPGEFLCTNMTRCIPNAWTCDGDLDCSDHSDETGCTSSPVDDHTCSREEFMCANYECVHLAWKCDGEIDCVDGSDEIDCHVQCRADQFKCVSENQCLMGDQECDGIKDCADGSDEPSTCPSLNPKCDDDEFDCLLDGKNCIPVDQVCNGHNDCGESEDEDPTMCQASDPCSTNNGGCDHVCFNSHRGAQCSCRAGYLLRHDNKTCEDIDECQIRGMCSQQCKNTIGSFRCHCESGYARDPQNHRYCKVDGEEPHLLFSNRYDMRKMGLHTGTYNPVLDQLKAAIGLDFDYNDHKVYYTDVALEQIMEADIMENKVNNRSTILIKNDVNTPDGLALDWIHKNIYWTDTGLNTIELLSLTGKYRMTLFNTDLDEPRAIVVDPRENQGWIYWSDWGSKPKIERAGMDGSRRSVIVDTDVMWPNGMTIDYVLNRLFWVDAKLHSIGSSDLAGLDREIIISSGQYLKHPFAITVFEDWLYWSDWETESIHSVRKFRNDTHNPHRVTNKVLGLQSPMDVRVFHSYKQPQAPHRCGSGNGGCSHLCLPAPKISLQSASFSCQCPNKMTMKRDGKTCLEPTTTTPITTTTTDSSSATTPHTVSKPATGDQVGEIAGIVVAIITALVFIAGLIGFFVYRSLMRRNIKCLNFDNPVYRKTTEDTFSLEKNQYQPSRTLPPTMEPLTAGTNEYV